MKLYEIECMDPKQCEKVKSVFTKENNPDICETAGFEPLEVKIKRMEQNGLVAQLTGNDFSSHDLRDIYLNHPEFDITPEDEEEEIYEKLQMRQEYINKMKAEILAKSNGVNVEAGTEEPEKTDKKVPPAAE